VIICSLYFDSSKASAALNLIKCKESLARRILNVLSASVSSSLIPKTFSKSFFELSFPINCLILDCISSLVLVAANSIVFLP